jgi:hypothetical protein
MKTDPAAVPDRLGGRAGDRYCLALLLDRGEFRADFRLLLVELLNLGLGLHIQSSFLGYFMEKNYFFVGRGGFDWHSGPRPFLTEVKFVKRRPHRRQ